jgi:TatD DNase family protein
MLVDSHCHLDFPDFGGELDDIMARAGNAGIGWMLTIGTHVSRFDGVLNIARTYPNVFCTVGIHPHEAAREPAVSAEHLVRMAAQDPKIVGFGESGLDYFYQHSPKEDQERNFRVHIAAARQSGLPVVVHTRDADEDTLRILRDEVEKGPFSGVIHCFSSGRDLAEGALDLGLYVSLSGIVTFKQATALRDIVKDLPADRLLVETDAPYLAPVPKRGKRNEPAFTAFTAAHVAGILGMEEETFARTTTDNFFRLFSKARAEPTTGEKQKCA